MSRRILVLVVLLLSSQVQAAGWGSKLGEAIGEISIIDSWNWLRKLNGVTTINPESIQAARLKYIAQTESGAHIPVRKQPSIKAAMLGGVRPGVEVTVLSKDPFSRWYEVEFANGAVGYIEKSFLTPARGS